MMAEVWYCDTCEAETTFLINGHPYCAEHAEAGIATQARLQASLHGAKGEDVERAGEWATQAMARMLETGRGWEDC
jgi:hypothetical protein